MSDVSADTRTHLGSAVSIPEAGGKQLGSTELRGGPGGSGGKAPLVVFLLPEVGSDYPPVLAQGLELRKEAGVTTCGGKHF